MTVKQEEAYEEGLFTGREEGISIGLEQGLERGAYQTKLETARTFLSMGFSPQQVAQGTGLPLETVQQLIV
jgi:predicted transposase/invertase (TIGR01784 family)